MEKKVIELNGKPIKFIINRDDVRLLLDTRQYDDVVVFYVGRKKFTLEGKRFYDIQIDIVDGKPKLEKFYAHFNSKFEDGQNGNNRMWAEQAHDYFQNWLNSVWDEVYNPDMYQEVMNKQIAESYKYIEEARSDFEKKVKAYTEVIESYQKGELTEDEFYDQKNKIKLRIW